MAENMVKVPWDQRNAAPGFGYAGGTRNILSAFNGLHHRGANKRYKDNQVLLQEQITYLRQLKEKLEIEEDAFFAMFGIKGKNKKESFEKLKKKIDNWNDTNAINLINDSSKGNMFWKGLSAVQRAAIFSEMPEEDWDDILDASLNTEEVRSLLDGNSELNIAEILNTILEKEEKNKYATAGSSSLLANLIVTLDKEDGTIHIRSVRGKISTQMQQKLIKDLTKYLEKQGKTFKRKRNYDFEKIFDDLFTQLNINKMGRFYILKAIKNDYSRVLDYYAFNSTESQIKGFLGEIYNNAFLLYMASNGGDKKAIERITPTGMILNQQGEELFIDTWLDGVGIQVKNYEKSKVMNEGFKVRKTYQVGNFITEALQLDSGDTGNTASVGDILLNFFTAYDFNQQYENLTDEEEKSKGFKFWRQTRDRMEEQFRKEKTFTETFTPYVDRMIGIDEKVETKDGMFNGQLYRNTFFNISGNYIPSSLVVQAIIDTVEKKQNEFTQMLRVHVSAPKHTLSEKDKWSPKVDNNYVAQVFEKRKEYANASSISYTVTLDVNLLVEYIKNNI